MAFRIDLAAIAAAATALSMTAIAQTDRERAVAIDRVPVPPLDHYEIEEIGPPLAAPWSLAFLAEGSFLVVEKHGGVRIIRADGSATPPLEGGPPNVLRTADSGLLDIALDPDFARNRTIFLAFVEGTEEANRTAIWKAQLHGDRLTGGQVIFRVNEIKKAPSHPGGRLLFLPDKTLLITVGDGFDFRDKAQDPSSHLGKILRLTRDGRAAPDNPFIGRTDHAPEIWTLGHRNPQGLTHDPVTGTVWEHEHGPRGGDEINELVGGRNYGWPAVTSGIDYDGTIISERAHAPGMTDPRFVWAPSIAPSGLAFYRGSAHPEFNGKLLVGALAARTLVQLRFGAKTGLLAEDGRSLAGLKARIRDVREAPDGKLYLLTDEKDGRLLRLVAASEAVISASHDLQLLAFLIGRWTGDSRFVPAFQTARVVEETSEIDCAPALQATYIRCTVRFYRKSDGRLRIIEHYINQDPETPGFEVQSLTSNWPGRVSYSMEWSEAEKAWVAFLPTDHDGQPATERIVEKPSPDGASMVHTEELRLQSTPDAPWTETFRWTWKRR